MLSKWLPEAVKFKFCFLELSETFGGNIFDPQLVESN